MTRILGSTAVVVALALAVYGAVSAVVGVRRRDGALIRSSQAAAYANCGLLTLATLAMVYALLTHDFSISYVAQVGSRSTPTFFTIISLWSALEGSILFWGFILSIYTASVVYFTRGRLGALGSYALATLHGVGIFFYLLLTGVANPFGAVSPVPADGPGPNPLLQNHPLMAVHPPFLYVGYVGMTVPFAFAIGALLSGRLDDVWLKTTRRWTMTAWIFLSLAIVAGMWWSYEVLGWGGYWAWDPVENASFMPWLTATAFLHSVMVQERRGMLRVWNLTLIIATFLLTILGTFLTRSGILSSVHAFANGPIGYYFLGFIALVLLFSLVLLAGRSAELKTAGHLDRLVSREFTFLLNNLLLSAFCFTVILGTLFPLVAEAVRGVKVSVGGPFFNRMSLPIIVTLLFLVGVGPALPWRGASADVLKPRLLPPAVAAVVVAALALVLRVPSVYAVLAFSFATFALVSNVQEFVGGARARMRAHGESAPRALVRLIGANRRRYGGYIAHLGVLAVATGIAASATYRFEREVTLKPGQTVTVREYTVRFDGLWAKDEPQRFVVGADMSAVDRSGKVYEKLAPRLNFYRGGGEPVTTPSVRTRLDNDLYINLLAFERDGSSATVHVIVEPLVAWIWIGGLIVALGAAIGTIPIGARARSRKAVRV
ncbi:MAG TPA: heme lyase CcmF/NrfE family subunit [Longimicrobiales bacterium]|nr:heme lyase CcmF/NrfE family subunit [Longimicrobiales bacterium]